MKKGLFLLSAILSFNIVFSQVPDTVYYNKKREVTIKDSMKYYRLVFKEHKLFRVQDYYKNGVLQMQGTYTQLEPEIKDGYFKHFTEDGNLKSEGAYVAGKREGDHKTYYPSGKLWQLNQYKNDTVSNFEVYYETGAIRRQEKYKNGELTSGKCYTADGKDTAFFKFEQMPEFPGGAYALNLYLSQNTKYPPLAKEKHIEGTVYVTFSVNREGLPEDVALAHGVHKILDEEALRVINSMPRWKPGQQDGKTVSVYYTVPIRFRYN